MMPLFTPTIAASIAGILCHLSYFVHREHHNESPSLFAGLPVFFGLFYLAQRNATNYEALSISAFSFAVFGFSLFTSILIYRLIFHPLRRFPGPFLARATKFWHVFHMPSSRNHLFLKQMHEMYGDIVRTGPNELTIFKAEAMQAVHGIKSKCIKSDWYDTVMPESSIHTTRNPSTHDKRRRIWDRGFNSPALQSYIQRTMNQISQLENRLSLSRGETIDCTQLFLCFAFDVMGDIAFGKSFDGIAKNELHPSIRIMQKGIKLNGPLTPVPWLFRSLAAAQGLAPGWKELQNWAESQVLQRMEMQRQDVDIMSVLIDAAKEGRDVIDMHWLRGDATTIVIAGSETVASALTFAFYELARLPEQTEKLRTELRGSGLGVEKLETCQHLNAIINETLRLYPPIPTGCLRFAPPEGLDVAGYHIPGGVTISTPMYNLGRMENCYQQASEFIPERWYEREDMIKDKSGFAPFLLGRYGCVGKKLALTEMRLVIASLVMKYDFSFAPGYDSAEVIDFKDCFTAIPGKLMLSFRPRE